MVIAFRIECPHCGWGCPWNDKYVNQGWLTHCCTHCGQNFYNKVTIKGFEVETVKELNFPVRTLPEAKQ